MFFSKEVYNAKDFLQQFTKEESFLGNNRKKARVGIITFHRPINYGALLQTYALQTSVERLGAECEIIDYHSNCIDSRHKKRVLSGCKGLKDVMRYILYAHNLNAKFDKFRLFASQFLHLSPACNDHDELTDVSSRYDILISGSDQVWNYNINECDTAYFLSFEKDNKKKNSYAASFGISKILL